MEVHDREDFLAGGTGGPTAAARTEEQERAVPTPDGGCVVAEVTSVRALGPGGGLRWVLPHAPWHGAARAHSARPSARTDGW
ncbi:hypothetical protein ACFVYT_38925 [Streptomyces sp. NPDC058290]|uniref:hypothetical protein n=1 Tax=Streptomyces sp. NPDC058290 TaxID=3346426 RepID=UPI0036F18528